MDTISCSDTIPSIDEKLAAAERYTSVAGWRIFVVRENKSTFPNCTTCAEAGYDHDFASCGHMFCHAQHAGTTDMGKIAEMFSVYPKALLAVATGRVSRLIALDFEGHTDDPELPTGLEVLDAWESYTSGMTLPPTLMARTRSGGQHLLYITDEPVVSRNRILPNTDVKADGGYIVLPPGPGRTWINRGLPSGAPDSLITWLNNREGRQSSAWNSRVTGQRVGHADGYNFTLFFRDGCPGGYRDEFINDLIFRLRKNGKTYAEAEQIVRYAHSRVAQPPYAKYPMPWSDVEYKLRRVWRTVTSDEDAVPDTLKRWAAEARNGGGWTQDSDGNTVKNVGRVTIVRRNR
jgi:hypothetical protein